MARLIKQNSVLREKFQERINQKIQADKDASKEKLRDLAGPFSLLFGGLADFALDFREAKNQLKGNIGEFIVSLGANTLPGDWIIFNDVILEPEYDILAQIDHVLIGPPGMFLVETKAWRGSFSGYRDKWKRRADDNWVECSSPTSQSSRHANLVRQWIKKASFSIPSRTEQWIIPLVVFTQAKWLRTTNCSTLVFDGMPVLINYLHAQKTTCLTLEQIEQIANLIANPSSTQHARPKPPKPKLLPKLASIPPIEEAEKYHQQGIEKAKQGKYQEAIEDFSKALCLNPNSAVTHKYRGIARSRLGDNQGAIADLQAAANLYQSQGKTEDYQKVLEHIRKIIAS